MSQSADPQPVQAGAELLLRLRKMAMCVYLAAEASVADDISDGLKQAIARIEALEAATLTDELTRLREKVGRMEKALERCAQIVKTNLYRQHEKVEDVVLIARQALADQPS